jgi:hypothetical protein
VATARVAILAALNIADEYYKTRRRKEEICREVEPLSASLLGKLSRIEAGSTGPSYAERGEEAAGNSPPAADEGGCARGRRRRLRVERSSSY